MYAGSLRKDNAVPSRLCEREVLKYTSRQGCKSLQMKIFENAAAILVFAIVAQFEIHQE
jgi:hypothetical protein